MRKSFILLLILLLSACGKKEPSYMGSRSCRECHEAFYTLWETSYHGRAMQDFTADFHEKHLTPCDSFIVSGNEKYRYMMTDSGAYMAEAGSGKQYPLLYALGGKYVYYFLTPREKGKLQTLPLGYDVGKKEWFDITASSIRLHQTRSDTPLPWTDRRYTFNTACYACHVSQLSSEYDINNDSYTSEWREAGINCETCHGPAETHNRIFREAEKSGRQPQETYLKTVVRSKGYTAEQVNASCSYCHAKMISLTPEYIPGETFFRHFDLVTYENPDHYPDGRDLGENYTFTSWRMSPCVQNSDMDCLHCHTSSGRYRQKEDPNASCLPCHRQRVEHVSAHSRHPEGSEGSICIHCHMPKTEFARMTRSDHSMRPPMPAATRAYGSPNACNLCHTGKPPAWADSVIQTRYTGRYQSETMEWAGYIHSLRNGMDDDLDAALDLLLHPGNEIVKASLVRCMRSFRNERIPPVMLELLGDPSPLVRASAATVLGSYLRPAVTEALCRATQDSIRLVRIRAAEALAELPLSGIPPRFRRDYEHALGEVRQSLQLFPDSEISHYNHARFLERRGRLAPAVSEYRKALTLRPGYGEAAVNLGMLYYECGNIDSAQYFFRHAIENNPERLSAYIDLALLYAETGKSDAAAGLFRKAYRIRKHASAAYNLAVLYSGAHPDSALYWSEQAFELERDDAKYIYSYAFYLRENGKNDKARSVLENAVDQHNTSPDIYRLLGALYRNSGEEKRYRRLMERAAADPRLSPREQQIFRR